MASPVRRALGPRDVNAGVNPSIPVHGGKVSGMEMGMKGSRMVEERSVLGRKYMVESSGENEVRGLKRRSGTEMEGVEAKRFKGQVGGMGSERDDRLQGNREGEVAAGYVYKEHIEVSSSTLEISWPKLTLKQETYAPATRSSSAPDSPISIYASSQGDAELDNTQNTNLTEPDLSPVVYTTSNQSISSKEEARQVYSPPLILKSVENEI